MAKPARHIPSPVHRVTAHSDADLNVTVLTLLRGLLDLEPLIRGVWAPPDGGVTGRRCPVRDRALNRFHKSFTPRRTLRPVRPPPGGLAPGHCFVPRRPVAVRGIRGPERHPTEVAMSKTKKTPGRIGRPCDLDTHGRRDGAGHRLARRSVRDSRSPHPTSSYILKQIKIAEAHVANTTSATGPCGALLGTGPNQLASPLVSFGPADRRRVLQQPGPRPGDTSAPPTRCSRG